jgi:hypothetical protein
MLNEHQVKVVEKRIGGTFQQLTPERRRFEKFLIMSPGCTQKNAMIGKFQNVSACDGTRRQNFGRHLFEHISARGRSMLAGMIDGSLPHEDEIVRDLRNIKDLPEG